MTRRKYRNDPVIVDGERFDSKGEYKRWRELQLLERSRNIRNLDRQVPIPLLAAAEVEGGTVAMPVLFASKRAAVHIVDFQYEERTNGKDWDLVYEDYKGGSGVDTPLSKLKRAIVAAMYGQPIRITKRGRA